MPLPYIYEFSRLERHCLANAWSIRNKFAYLQHYRIPWLFILFFRGLYIVVDHRFTLHRVYGVSWKKGSYWTPLLLYLLAFFFRILEASRGIVFLKKVIKNLQQNVWTKYFTRTGHLYFTNLSRYSISNNNFNRVLEKNQQEIVGQTSLLK